MIRKKKSMHIWKDWMKKIDNCEQYMLVLK